MADGKFSVTPELLRKMLDTVMSHPELIASNGFMNSFDVSETHAMTKAFKTVSPSKISGMRSDFMIIDDPMCPIDTDEWLDDVIGRESERIKDESESELKELKANARF